MQRWLQNSFFALFVNGNDMSLKHLIRRGFHALGYDLIPASFSAYSHVPYAVITSHASYAPWLEQGPFNEAYRRIQGNTLVDVHRCYELWQLAQQLASCPGNILEIGVWRGGTGCLMAKASPSKTVFLCDTFSGVVKASQKDSSYKGNEHADTSVNVVKKLAAKLEVQNIRILQGIFPDETAPQIDADMLFSLCHIDVDTYQSARDCFDWVWPRMAIGGVVIFDDYGFYGCDGVTTLCNELGTRTDNLMLYNLNGHAILVKQATP